MVLSYVVYQLSFLRDGIMLLYIGIAGVYSNQTVKAALAVRKAWHISMPKFWLKGMDPSSLSISEEQAGLSLQAALAEEARVTANKYHELGPSKVRGGPWVRKDLTYDDRMDIAPQGSVPLGKQ